MIGEHSCEETLSENHNLTSGYWQEGTTLTCSCGKRWEHICDEAEGCFWRPA